jgi:hypothetical protein
MKIIARELLWFFTAVVIGLPVGYIYLKYLALQPEGDNYKIQEEVFEMEFFLMGWFIGVIGTYIARLVKWAICKIFIPDEK